MDSYKGSEPPPLTKNKNSNSCAADKAREQRSGRLSVSLNKLIY